MKAPPTHLPDNLLASPPCKVAGGSEPLSLTSKPLHTTIGYRAPRWLPGGHLQTIYPAVCLSKPLVNYRRERWTTPDNDFIDIDFVDGKPENPLVVLFHGLEGSSNSHYCRALMAMLKTLHWSGAVPHFRGCSGEMNHAPRFYHSGDTKEIDWILRRMHAIRAKQGVGPLYAAGVSLGGNALLRWLGEFQSQANIVQAACAICAPLDLVGGGVALSQGFNRFVYARVFLRTMKMKSLQKLNQFPTLFNREHMLNAQDLYAFDNVVTAPLHGYRNAEEYWQKASSKHVLNDIVIPTLVLNAKNDPFLPPQHLPTTAARCVTLEYPEEGGHVGFPIGCPPGYLTWLPQRIIAFLSDF